MVAKSPQRSNSFASRFVRRFHRATQRFRQKRDVEIADEEGMNNPIVRHRPDTLEELIAATKFTKEEIRWVYRAFKQECPAGAINEQTFKNIYAHFFPLGVIKMQRLQYTELGDLFRLTDHKTTPRTLARQLDSSRYAHYVFAALDKEHTGTITFKEFMLGLSIVMKGTLQERLHWAFSLYDVNQDGYITKADMLAVITAIYDLLGDNSYVTSQCPQIHVNKMFKKLDLNNDGVITVDEFINYCSMDENIRNSFAVFDDLW